MNETSNKTVAKAVTTGLYFNGRAFEAQNVEDALALPSNTTAESFRISWAAEVAIETVEQKQSSAGETGESLASRIYRGDLTPESAAKVYIIRQRRSAGQKSFTVYIPWAGKYVSRIPVMPRGKNAFWIRYGGGEWAVIWKNGELSAA